MRISDWSSDVCSSDLALTHEVHHPALLGIVEIEIEIYLAPAFMDVRRHRVPHASRLEDREAHRQLRAVAYAGDDELVDRPVVGRLQAAALEHPGAGERQFARVEGAMGEIGRASVRERVRKSVEI